MKFNLFKIFKKGGSPKKNFSLVSFEPLSDWKKLLAFLFILSLAGVVSSGYIFWTVQNGSAFGIDSIDSGETPLPNINELDKVGEQYRVKAKKFQELSSSTPLVVDPAI